MNIVTVPKGNFAAATNQTILAQYADKIPSIAYSIPDIALQATIELKSLDDGRNVECIIADIGNGKSVNSGATTYVAAGIAEAPLLITGMTSLMSGGGGGESGKVGPGPNFMEITSWFQTIATTGMLSVNYPPPLSKLLREICLLHGTDSLDYNAVIDRFFSISDRWKY